MKPGVRRGYRRRGILTDAHGAQVILTPTALANLDRIIDTHSLPADKPDRFRRSLRPLSEFPLIGSQF